MEKSAGFLLQLIESGFGKAGIILVLATVMDTIKKRMTGSGVFEEVGQAAFTFFEGIGEMIAKVIYGNKIEKQLVDLLKKTEHIPDKAWDGLISGLKSEQKKKKEE